MERYENMLEAWDFRTTLEYATALHWIGVNDVPRALILADHMLVRQPGEAPRNSLNLLKERQVDIWLNAANRSVQRGEPEQARKLLARAAPIVRGSASIAARGYFAWLLQQSRDEEASDQEFAAIRRGREKNADFLDPTATENLWLAVWHIRAGHFREAAEFMRAQKLYEPETQDGYAYLLPSYMDGKIQSVNFRGDKVIVSSGVLAPYAEKMLALAETALASGDKTEAKSLLLDSEVYSSTVPGLPADSKSAKQQLIIRSAALYAALGNASKAAELRKSTMLPSFESVMRIPAREGRVGWLSTVPLARCLQRCGPGFRKMKEANWVLGF